MSYILEALKKAQAERQLGHAPTIHDLPVQPPPVARVARSATAMWVALGAGAVLAAGAVFAWWRQGTPPVQVAAAPVVLPAAQPVPAPVPVPVPPPAAPAPAESAPQPAIAPAPQPAFAPPQLRAVAPAPQPAIAPPQQRAIAPRPQPAPAAPVARPAPPVVAEAPAPEENLPLMRELPQSVQQSLPAVAFGGYMYSKNPADRLLLIDKVLRHEGEEVAPGLVLEKLLPRAAVMNYRGTRYRVAY